MFAVSCTLIQARKAIASCAALLLVLSLGACGGSGGGGGGGGSVTDAGNTDGGASSSGGDSSSSGGTSSSGGDTASSSGGTDAGSSSSGADAGASSGGACGDVPETGKCDGAKLSWCSKEKTLQSEDCAKYFEGTQTGVCIEVDKTQGHFCAAPVGGECLFEDEDGDLSVEFCGGKEGGCIELPDGATCTENTGTCTAADENTCKGNLAIWHCNAPQPAATDCAAFGGKCEVKDKEAICTGIGEGKDCDPDYGINCAAGLSCEGASADAWGTCKKK